MNSPLPAYKMKLNRSNGDIDDEDMGNITDWDDNDFANGISSQVTFDGKSCMKLDSGTPAVISTYAKRSQDIGTLGDICVISLNIYFEALGNFDNNNFFYFEAGHQYATLCAVFASDGLRIFDGNDNVLIDSNIVTQNEWHEWTFVIKHSEYHVNIYLDGILKFRNISLPHDTGITNGLISFQQYGNSTANRITYIDWFKAGSGLI